MDLTNFDISLKFVYACIYFLAIDKQNKCVFYTVRPIKNVNRYRLLYFKIKLSVCLNVSLYVFPNISRNIARTTLKQRTKILFAARTFCLLISDRLPLKLNNNFNRLLKT